MNAKQSVILLLVVSVLLAACGQTPTSGEVKSSCLFRLPWTSTLGKIEVTQGNSDTQEKRSHRPGSVMEYAFDFAIPKDNPVLATREGTVSDIHDGETRAGGAELINNANYVIIDHGDGTFSLYAHLRAGIPVSIGQKVVQGQVLGYVGNTGWTYGGYHLHYQVQRQGKNFGQSIPTCFQEVSQTPKEGRELFSLNQPVQVLGIQVTAVPAPGSSAYEAMLGTWEGEVSGLVDGGGYKEAVRFIISENCPQGRVCLITDVVPEAGIYPSVEDAMRPEMRCFGDGYDFYCFSLQENGTLKYNGHGPLWAAEGVLHRSNTQGMLDMADALSVVRAFNSALKSGSVEALGDLFPEDFNFWAPVPDPAPSCEAVMGRWCSITKSGFLQEIDARMKSKLTCTYWVGNNVLIIETAGWNLPWVWPYGSSGGVQFNFFRIVYEDTNSPFRLKEVFFYDYLPWLTDKPCP